MLGKDLNALGHSQADWLVLEHEIERGMAVDLERAIFDEGADPSNALVFDVSTLGAIDAARERSPRFVEALKFLQTKAMPAAARRAARDRRLRRAARRESARNS